MANPCALCGKIHWARHSGSSAPYPKWVREPILEMKRQGLSGNEIEAVTGVDAGTVYRWYRESGREVDAIREGEGER